MGNDPVKPAFGNKFPVCKKCLHQGYLWFVIFNLSTARVSLLRGAEFFSSVELCLALPTRSRPSSVWWSLSMKEGSTSVAYKPGNIINVLSDFSNWSLNTNSLISGWLPTVSFPMWDVTHHWLDNTGRAELTTGQPDHWFQRIEQKILDRDTSHSPQSYQPTVRYTAHINIINHSNNF